MSPFKKRGEEGRPSHIAEMPIPDLCNFFKDLKDNTSHANALPLIEKYKYHNVLNSTEIADMIETISLMESKEKAWILLQIGESNRLELLHSLKDPILKTTFTTALDLHQQKLALKSSPNHLIPY